MTGEWLKYESPVRESARETNRTETTRQTGKIGNRKEEEAQPRPCQLQSQWFCMYLFLAVKRRKCLSWWNLATESLHLIKSLRFLLFLSPHFNWNPQWTPLCALTVESLEAVGKIAVQMQLQCEESHSGLWLIISNN